MTMNSMILIDGTGRSISRESAFADLHPSIKTKLGLTVQSAWRSRAIPLAGDRLLPSQSQLGVPAQSQIIPKPGFQSPGPLMQISYPFFQARS